MNNVYDLKDSITNKKRSEFSFDYIKINIASPLKIKNWCERLFPDSNSIGEIKAPKILNEQTFKIQDSGLFCEKVFGPLKSWQCHCGKYKGLALKQVCEFCHVELTDTKVRRYRMGYIELKSPIAHFWYLNGEPNYFHLLLNSNERKIKKSELQNLIYFSTEEEYNKPYSFFIKFLENELNYIIKIQRSKLSGTEILKMMLENLNLKLELAQLRECLNTEINSKNKEPNFKKIRIFESFIATKTNPSWILLTILPILPPNLRPLYELESGKLIATGINTLYQNVFFKNYNVCQSSNFATILKLINGVELQKSIDCLIDNARVSELNKQYLNNKVIKSLTEILEGKQGRFRHSLLGKRVDYSGRSVIVVGPTLRLNQCGLPYFLVKELFKSFLIKEFSKLIYKLNVKKVSILSPIPNLKLLNLLINCNKPFIYTVLIKLLKYSNILLNRAPTLHQFGLQAFNPILSFEKVILLHPLVCTGFNADFDGDQMAVHLPLSKKSNYELLKMMRPIYNILSPSNGSVILKPTQDMVIGCYYLTLMLTENKNISKKWFTNHIEVLNALSQKKINIHTSILIRSLNLNGYFKIENKILKLLKTKNNTILLKQKIIILKVFKTYNTYFIITNIGVINCFLINKNYYKIINYFIETTPGRILFNTNFQHILAIKNYVY